MYLYIYTYIYIYVVPPQKIQSFCFYLYLQCFNNILADIFEEIKFEGCAWFLGPCVFSYVFFTHYSSLFWQYYMVGFQGDDINSHIHIMEIYVCA